ncbi:stringent starvation protein B [Thiogranum longum]|uniref:Stringent starvation protein B n=1 Tax=Thiogranum longum TaxID=1537524 RepID=A0A4R1HB69_9GAMM|nr:ClpXP protease specificity-enhancing factor [Thiogranum longum]TCK17851.1 stringent starvation protein B [Thiogranum longum]
MTSNRPYLLRAIHEWLLDNQCTPHLMVDANAEGVDVPKNYIQDGKIVLNIGPSAVEGLRISNDEVSFLARFSGVSQLVSIPMNAVLAIYAKENGRGMMFGEEGDAPDPDGDKTPEPPTRPSLKVVK